MCRVGSKSAYLTLTITVLLLALRLVFICRFNVIASLRHFSVLMILNLLMSQQSHEFTKKFTLGVDIQPN